MHTTLNKLRQHKMSYSRLKAIGNYTADEPISIKDIVKSNGLADAIWCLRAVDSKDQEICFYAIQRMQEVADLIKSKVSIETLGELERLASQGKTDEFKKLLMFASSMTADEAAIYAIRLLITKKAWANNDWHDTWEAEIEAQAKKLIEICEE